VKVDGDPMAMAIGPDGRLAAWAAYSSDDDHQTEVVWSGRRSPEKGEVWRMCVSPDGRSLAYVAQRSGPDGQRRSVVVHDGRDGPAFSGVDALRFAPDGRVAYRAFEGAAEFLVVGDTKIRIQGEQPIIPFRFAFSPDMRRAGYGAVLGRELWWKVVALK
jgi:hypothetical protein